MAVVGRGAAADFLSPNSLLGVVVFQFQDPSPREATGGRREGMVMKFSNTFCTSPELYPPLTDWGDFCEKRPCKVMLKLNVLIEYS